MVKVFDGDGQTISMPDYKEEVLLGQSMCCPVTLEITDIYHGEVLINHGTEWFISQSGLAILRHMFGDRYINEKIVGLGVEEETYNNQDMG